MDKTGIDQMLRKLTEADGPSGSEDAVAAVVRCAGAASTRRSCASMRALRWAASSPDAAARRSRPAVSCWPRIWTRSG